MQDKRFIISNCKIIVKNGILEKRSLIIEDGKIREIASKEMQCDYDGKGCYLSPGFIDIHTHGGYGGDFMDAADEAFDKVLNFHIDNGTTALLATSVTAPVEQLVAFMETARKYKNKSTPYAKVLGVHLEGPYLSERNKGAQKKEYLRIPEKDDYSFMGEYADTIKTVTISPELPGASEMTRFLTDRGIVVCGGHDDGIFPEFMPAIENGLSHLTHIYCAMSEVRFKDGKRNVGLREYGLIDDRLTAEMIADNRHITPELAKMIVGAKGADKTCVVSDCLRCAGMPRDGRLYTLGSANDPSAQKFKVADGVAVLADGERYAGSITCVRQMVVNLIEAGIPICDAFRMATSTPAKIIGEDDIGEIAVGKTADLCVLDKEFNVVNVFKDGELIK